MPNPNNTGKTKDSANKAFETGDTPKQIGSSIMATKNEFRDTVMNKMNIAGLDISKKETTSAIDAIFDSVLSTLQTPGEKVTMGTLGIMRFKPKPAKPAATRMIFGKETKIKAKPASMKPAMTFSKAIKEEALRLHRTKAFKEHLASK